MTDTTTADVEAAPIDTTAGDGELIHDTHVVDWAAALCVELGLPDTHSNRSALAAWALASNRADVEAAVIALLPEAPGHVRAPVDRHEVVELAEPEPLTDDQQRLAQLLRVGADADAIARAVANGGGPDVRTFVRHVIDGDHSAFDPDDIAAAQRADVEAVAQRQAADDNAPATRGDIRALTDALTGLVSALQAQVVPQPAAQVPPARPSSPRKAAGARKAPPAKKTASKATAAPRAPRAATPAPASPAAVDAGQPPTSTD